MLHPLRANRVSSATVRQRAALVTLAALAFATQGCFYWLHGTREASDGYPDTALAGFVPLAAGQVTYSLEIDGAGRPTGGRSTETVEHLVPATATAPTTAELVDDDWDADGSQTHSRNLVRVFRDRIEVVTPSKAVEVPLRTPLRPGTRWTYRGATRESRREIIEIADVCTPRGRFHRAIHVRTTMVPLDPTSGKDTLAVDQWYVPGVGEVLTKVVPRRRPEIAFGYFIERFESPGTSFSPPPCGS